MSRLAFCIVALMAAATLDAASIKWTGYANNGQWETPQNWYPDQVPGASDDVSIDQGGNVTMTTPQTVQSISMGAMVGHYPFLIVDSALLVESTLTVNVNGGIVIASGSAMITGTVECGGTLSFQSGAVSGAWTIAKGATLDMSSAAQKALIGAQFNIAVDTDMSGVVVLNQSSILSTSATITSQGDLSVQAGDATKVQFDTSKGTLTYNGGGTYQVMAPWSVGTFNFVAGNLTIFETVSFAASFAVPEGSTMRSLGVAAVSLPAGLTGSGYVHVEGATFTVGGANFTGKINAQAGTFESSAASTISTLEISGAAVTVSKDFNVATCTMTAGQIQGSATLTIGSGSLQSAGFNVNATTVITGKFAVIGSVISIGGKGKIQVAKGGSMACSATSSISGPPSNGGVQNEGMISATGALSATGVSFTGTGSITVSDEFTISTLQLTQGAVALSGNGKFLGSTAGLSVGKVTGTPGVTGTIGAYSFTCPKECDNVDTASMATTNFEFAVSK